MYLTKIELRDENAARLFPANPYNWHKRIWSFFKGKVARDFLYRIDYNGQGLRILIVSQDEPQYPMEWNDKGYQAFFSCKQIPESFLEHEWYHFQVRVNPTRRVKLDKRTGNRTEKGLREPLIIEKDLISWLLRKGREGGFSIPNVEEGMECSDALTIIHEGRMNFRKYQHRGHHASVQFSGVLKVENSELFKQTFQNGIGSAKSFGFGLLMLQPINK